MQKYTNFGIQGIHLLLVVSLVSLSSTKVFAQCGFQSTCSNTNYLNFGMASNGDGATIEYDNFTSSFHSTVVRTSTGDYKIWGEYVAADGTNNLLEPTVINSTNFPGLTGNVLKANLGSDYTPTVQGIVLTTTGLFAWGTEGGVIHPNLTTSTAFQKITVAGNTQGLPSGVTPLDVKMLFVTANTIALTTCSGSVYMLTQTGENAGRGLSGTLNAAASTQWYQVTTTAAGNPALSNVIAVRGNLNTLFALTSSGQLYTWGTETYLGNNTAQNTRTRAALMTAPSVNSIKMIGVTRDNGNTISSYYVLNSNGNLYALGGNTERQLGDWSTTERRSWIQPRYTSTSGPVMNNIHWISPNEHDNRYAAINVLTSDSTNYNWGDCNGEMLGRGTTTNANPGIPNGISASDKILAVESGGHTSMLVKKCEDFFGYVGHRIRGSMGDGTNNTTNESTYSFATAVVYICGATNVNVSISGVSITGSSGLYCNGSSINVVAEPAGGTYSVVGPATLSGTILTFNGTGNTTVNVSYTYTITGCPISATAGVEFLTEDCNIPPIANDDVTSTNEDTPVVINVPSNDTDSNGLNPSSVSITTPPVNGTVTVNSTTGNITYTPNLNYSGSDSFVYTICDNGIPVMCDQATVTITVNPSNDIPSFAPGANQSLCEGSSAQSIANWATSISSGPLNEAGQLVSFNVTNNNNVLFATQPAISSNGTLTYTPAIGQSGIATVSVTLQDNGGTSNGGINSSATIQFTITVNANPIAGITAPATTVLTCATTSIALTAAGGGTYLWNDALATATASLNVSTPGIYTVTVTSANGCTDTESITITQDITYPIAGITSPSTTTLTCGTTSIALTATGGGTYLWNDASATATATLNVTTSGTYTVTVISANGCTDTESITITQSTAAPTAGITAPASTVLTCVTTSIALTATGGGTYLWNNASVTTTATLNVTTPGTYTVTVTSANGCTDTESITITQSTAVPTAGITAPATTVLTCGTTSIAVTATGGGTYLWNDALATATASLNVSTPGTYTVTVTSANGCTDTESITITQSTAAPTAGITAPATTVLTCGTTSIALTATGGGTYLWNDALATATASLNVSTPGTYTVTVTSANGCSDTESITITQSTAVPTAGITAPATTVLTCGTTSIALTATGVGTYLWNDASATTTATLNVSTPGTYTVTVTSANGCTDTESITITQNCVIDAIDDLYSQINGYLGATTSSVLDNDQVDGALVVSSDVNLTYVSGDSQLTLNPDGTITIATGTTAGIYTLMYQICVLVNPSFCDQAIVTVTVSSAVIDAVVDTYGPINGYTGGTTTSVLTNDVLNGSSVNASEVTLTSVSVPSGLTLNADGTISVASGTPAGTYTVTYQICENLNPGNCDQATATIEVVNNAPEANQDSVSIDEDSIAVIDIVSNDSDIDGNIDPTSVTILDQPNNGIVSVDPTTGVITYTPNSNWNGSDTLIYQLCDLGTPALCDTASVFITVNQINDGPIVSQDQASTDEDVSVVIDVTLNDTDIDGSIDPTTVNVVEGPINGSIAIDPFTGVITYTPNSGFTGVDTFVYIACDNGTPLPALCDTTVVIITVAPCLSNPAFDCDGDGVTNGSEIADGTNPEDPCSLLIGSQTVTPSIEWIGLDCDNDGLDNGAELDNNTNVFNPDTDGDGVTDGSEVGDVTDPLNPCSFNPSSVTLTPSIAWLSLDCDNDGLDNGDELTNNTDVFNPDTDGDGVLDGTEVNDLTNPTDPCDLLVSSITVAATAEWLSLDCDNDGLSNSTEIGLGTEVFNPDTDADGVIDGTEVADQTLPLDPCSLETTSITVAQSVQWGELDCDNDGVSNSLEATSGIDPFNPDTDGDGVLDGTELLDETNPLDPCDYLAASQSVTPSLEWNNLDCDGDGLTNIEELNGNSDPQDPCSPVNCELTIPQAITPNGDGFNEVFVIDGIENYPNNELIIFNRWGAEVFRAIGYSNDWNGKSTSDFNIWGEDLPTGTYYYLFDTKQDGVKPMTGFIYLTR